MYGSLIKNIQALDILCYARLMKYTAFFLFIALMTSHVAAQTPADAMSRKSQNWQNLQNSRPSVARPNFTVNEFDSSLKAMPLPAPPIADGGGVAPKKLVQPELDGGLIGGGVAPEKSDPIPPPVNVIPKKSDPLPPPR